MAAKRLLFVCSHSLKSAAALEALDAALMACMLDQEVSLALIGEAATEIQSSISAEAFREKLSQVGAMGLKKICVFDREDVYEKNSEEIHGVRAEWIKTNEFAGCTAHYDQLLSF